MNETLTPRGLTTRGDSGHTPGPWKVGLNGSGEFAVWSTRPAQNIIAKLFNVPHEHNTEANACLIAAAPDLLNAVHCLRAGFTKPSDDEISTKTHQQLRDVLDYVDHAIAKAEGK